MTRSGRSDRFDWEPGERIERAPPRAQAEAHLQTTRQDRERARRGVDFAKAMARSEFIDAKKRARRR